MDGSVSRHDIAGPHFVWPVHGSNREFLRGPTPSSHEISSQTSKTHRGWKETLKRDAVKSTPGSSLHPPALRKDQNERLRFFRLIQELKPDENEKDSAFTP
jgi:hypothetical protein